MDSYFRVKLNWGIFFFSMVLYCFPIDQINIGSLVQCFPMGGSWKAQQEDLINSMKLTIFPEIWYLGKGKKSLVVLLFTTLVVSFQQAALNKYDKFAYVLLPLIFNSWVLVKYLCIWFILKLILKPWIPKYLFSGKTMGPKIQKTCIFHPALLL